MSRASSRLNAFQLGSAATADLGRHGGFSCIPTSVCLPENTLRTRALGSINHPEILILGKHSLFD